MKKHLALYLFLLICIKVNAQEKTVYIDGYAMSSNISSFTMSKSGSSQNDIKGNPYYNSDWMFGEVKIKNSKTYKGLFKYNIHLQQMEMVNEKDTFIISNPLYVEHVKFSNFTFIYSLIVNYGKGPGKISGSYFEAHNNIGDKYVLLSKFKSNVRVNDFGSKYGGGIGDGSKSYSTNRSFYIKLDNGPAQKLHLSKGGVLKYFADNKTVVKKYIKENNLNMTDIEDITALFDHFNKVNLSDVN